MTERAAQNAGAMTNLPLDYRAIDRIVKMAWPMHDVGHDVMRLLSRLLVNGFTVAAPLPTGPRIFLATRQFGIDLHLMGLLLAGFTQRPVAVATPATLALSHYGELLRPIFTRALASQGRERPLLSPVLWGQDSASWSAVFDTPGDLIKPDLVLPVTANPMTYETEEIERIDPDLLALVTKHNYNVIPARVAWGLPSRDEGHRFAWPYRLSPVHFFLGEPIRTVDPDRLASVLLRSFSSMADAAPRGHADRNTDCAERTWAIVEQTGITQSKALIIDLLLTADKAALSEEGQMIRDLIRRGVRSPLAHETHWLANFAMLLTDGLATDGIPFQDLFSEASIA